MKDAGSVDVQVTVVFECEFGQELLYAEQMFVKDRLAGVETILLMRI